jgi:hypothetical protein
LDRGEELTRHVYIDEGEVCMAHLHGDHKAYRLEGTLRLGEVDIVDTQLGLPFASGRLSPEVT